ncbi:hypothetical protein HDV00_000183 [Rhizophlyctis rosea]|nr:hypothetical protein HDV00_000183 [Rhizophlyctis rosea]
MHEIDQHRRCDLLRDMIKEEIKKGERNVKNIYATLLARLGPAAETLGANYIPYKQVQNAIQAILKEKEPDETEEGTSRGARHAAMDSIHQFHVAPSLPVVTTPRGVDIIIKLGGSVLTTKPSPVPVLAPIAQLQTLLQLLTTIRPPERAIIIHGAGSYGHPHAHAYALAPGFSTTEVEADVKQKYIMGIATTRNIVSSLNRFVVTSLIEKGVPAATVTPSEHLDGKWERGYEARPAPPPYESCSALLDKVETILSAGMVPVLHGDVVASPSWGCGIVSGDDIMVSCAWKFKPKRGCVYVTDVDGVWTGDPKEPVPEGHPLPVRVGKVTVDRVSRKVEGGALDRVGKGAEGDVSGGMKKKLETAVNIVSGPPREVEWECPVRIVRVGTEDVARAIGGKELVGGTLFEAAPLPDGFSFPPPPTPAPPTPAPHLIVLPAPTNPDQSSAEPPATDTPTQSPVIPPSDLYKTIIQSNFESVTREATRNGSAKSIFRKATSNGHVE